MCPMENTGYPNRLWSEELTAHPLVRFFANEGREGVSFSLKEGISDGKAFLVLFLLLGRSNPFRTDIYEGKSANLNMSGLYSQPG